MAKPVVAKPFIVQPLPVIAPAGTLFVTPVPIIGPQYCELYPVDLALIRKVMIISDGNFVVTDTNGNVILKVKGAILSLRDRRVLIDGTGNPIVTLRQKV